MDTKYGLGTKQLMLEEISEKLEKNSNFVITNYKGIASIEIEKLRKALGKNSCGYLAVKNSLMKKALKSMDLQDAEKYLSGQIAIGLLGDVLKGAKTLVEFEKENKSFKMACAVLKGKVHDAEKVKYLAALPSKEALLAMALSYMKSPITGFVGVLKGLLRSFVYVISEIKSKKEGGDKK